MHILAMESGIKSLRYLKELNINDIEKIISIDNRYDHEA